MNSKRVVITVLFAIPTFAELPAAVATKGVSLDPFTQVAMIPAEADLSSIRFERAKLTRIPTQVVMTMDRHYCEGVVQRASGPSMFCPAFQSANRVYAYEVTYSYQGQPLASDEYGSRYFTFSVYFHPDQLAPATREAIARPRLSKADAAALFAFNPQRPMVRKTRIVKAASKLCEAVVVDGYLEKADAKCEDRIVHETIAAPSTDIVVRVTQAAGTD